MYVVFRFLFICLNCRSMYCIDLKWENAIAVKNGQNEKLKHAGIHWNQSDFPADVKQRYIFRDKSIICPKCLMWIKQRYIFRKKLIRCPRCQGCRRWQRWWRALREHSQTFSSPSQRYASITWVFKVSNMYNKSILGEYVLPLSTSTRSKVLCWAFPCHGSTSCTWEAVHKVLGHFSFQWFRFNLFFSP